MREEHDHEIAARDGARLLADVLRPDDEGKFPALVAFSPYPRQLQNSGAPLAFVEAGASDYFVPRGYAHVIVNARGSCGSDEAVTPGAVTRYEIGVVSTAQRVLPGQRLRVTLTSNDAGSAMLGFEHLPLGLASIQRVLASSVLRVPVLGGALPRGAA